MADKQPFPSQQQDRFIVRLPDGMRSRIAQAAKDNNRSMNAEIVARLMESFRYEDAGDLPDAKAAFDLIKQERMEQLMQEIARLAEAKFDQAARDWLKKYSSKATT